MSQKKDKINLKVNTYQFLEAAGLLLQDLGLPEPLEPVLTVGLFFNDFLICKVEMIRTTLKGYQST